MDRSLLLPLSASQDQHLAGGKAVGLARLIAAGFLVPQGLCVTTASCCRAMDAAGFSAGERWEAVQHLAGEARRQALAECQILIRDLPISGLVLEIIAHLHRLGLPAGTLWAVRSSATNEDQVQASFAGVYRTVLGVTLDQIGAAIKEVWASIWDERVVAYHAKTGLSGDPPAMAVVIQPMLNPQASGVAYSIHPVTGRSNLVVVNAVLGLASTLVDGTAVPDQYVVRQEPVPDQFTVVTRDIANKVSVTRLGQAGVEEGPFSRDAGIHSSLSDQELTELARVVKRVEQTIQHPVDIEWALEAGKIWLLQARPVTAVSQPEIFTNDECEWTRANFKETMPEVPSPMGLSFLDYFMSAYIIAHYRRLGCHIPKGLSSVRVLHGRPYLNVSLFHYLVGQLRGDPSLNIEQMGGEHLHTTPPAVRLGWLAYIRAGWLMLREMHRVANAGPRWFAEMKQLAVTYRPDRIRDLSRDELAVHLDRLSRWLDSREVTFGIAAGVGQCLQAFSSLLPQWLGADWRNLLNAALQGQGTVISAQQIMRLAEMVQLAREDEAAVRALLTESLDYEACSARLKGSAFIRTFDLYLEDYGHRGLGESDVMSPRFIDQPDSLLNVVRVQLRGPASSPENILVRQRETRIAALKAIRARCGRRWDRWLIFKWWHRRLCRFFTLREANRHHLMYYSTAARQLLLRLGERFVEGGVFTSREDIFFLTLEERQELVAQRHRDWAALVRHRRTDRARWLTMQVPDTIRDWETAAHSGEPSLHERFDDVLRGIPISPGVAGGVVRHVRSTADWGKVGAGDIIVAPVIDPGMAPLFGIAAGLIVEMGGTLSHGAIIAREYGLPTVANVTGAMLVLKEGDRIRLDAGAGEVRLE